MLGRKDFTLDEFGSAHAAVAEQLTAYRELAAAVDKAGDAALTAALEALEPVLFGNLVLALDRFFVHRVRAVSGKATTPVNEVELIAESLMARSGLRTHKVITYRAGDAVLGLAPGERIRLTADDFERLADGFLADVAEKFL